MKYIIIWSRESLDQLGGLTARDRKIIADAIEIQLTYQPTQETRNRKKLRENPFASWELRVGSLRIFYESGTEPVPEVRILGIGTKQGNAVYVAGKVIEWTT